jgi:hypothetical protein
MLNLSAEPDSVLFQHLRGSITHGTLERVQGDNPRLFMKPSRLKSLLDRNCSHIALGLFFLAFATRILYLSAPSLWLDEAISANIIKGSIADCIQRAKADLHPPLYYVLLHLWSFS